MAIRPVVVLALTIIFSSSSRADEPEMKRGQAMKARIMALSVDGQPGGQHFGDEPILRYSDPTRRIADASVWRLGRSGRPRAVVVLEVYSGRSIQIEPTAVVDPPRHVKGVNWQWSPASLSFTWTSIPVDIDAMGDTAKLQRIAKQLSRRFSADETFRGQTYQLRRMPQPLLEYVDDSKGVATGAMFAWAHGTNVEALMFIEAHDDKNGKSRWVAGFSRLGAASLDIKFSDEPFWNAPAMPSTNSTSPYYYRMLDMTSDEREVFTEGN